MRPAHLKISQTADATQSGSRVGREQSTLRDNHAQNFPTVTNNFQRTNRSTNLLTRGRKVMLDEDLADLYCVETKALIQAVKRNPGRFPEDFMFQLSQEEWSSLRSQIVTSNGRGGRRYAPYAFTEHGRQPRSGHY